MEMAQKAIQGCKMKLLPNAQSYRFDCKQEFLLGNTDWEREQNREGILAWCQDLGKCCSSVLTSQPHVTLIRLRRWPF